MKFASYKITDEAGGVVFKSDNAVEAFVAGIAFQHFNVPAEDLKKVARMAYNMYLKGDYISLGHLTDFVAEHYKRLKNKSVKARLDEFYEYTDLGGY